MFCQLLIYYLYVLLRPLWTSELNSSDVSDVFEYLGHRKDFNSSISTFLRNEELAEFI